jgi:aminoglycoside phosphotransferase (APT) family kinase protein
VTRGADPARVALPFPDVRLLSYPEPQWERSVACPAIDDAFLDAHLSGRPELRRRRWTPLPGGLRHAMLRSDDLVLRVALSAEQDLAREAAVLRHVASSVRVPRVVDAWEGALVLEHVAHEELPASDEAGRAAGRAAARLHRTRYERSGFLDASLRVPSPFPGALRGLLDWAGEALRGASGRALGDVAAEVSALWRAHAPALETACAAPALVHADFKAANVKWLPRERDVLLLDWEFAWAGPPLMDLGQMLRWEEPPPFRRGLEEGYRGEGGVLPDGWRRTAEALDLFALVGLLDASEGKPTRVRDLVRRIRATVAR